MAPLKCCVSGCTSTSSTHKLFCMPSKDSLRNLWMSLLVPTSPYLLVLSQGQLMGKRVCEKHFDRTQFDAMGIRIRWSYPCLFTEDEFIHGVPLCSEGYNFLQEHNYYHNRDPEDSTETSNQILFVDTSGLWFFLLFKLANISLKGVDIFTHEENVRYNFGRFWKDQSGNLKQIKLWTSQTIIKKKSEKTDDCVRHTNMCFISYNFTSFCLIRNQNDQLHCVN